MDPNGKLFYAKLEEGNGDFGDLKPSLSNGREGLQEMRRKGKGVFLGER